MEHGGIEGLTRDGCSVRVVVRRVSLIHHDWLIVALTAQPYVLAASPINFP
jgi:hypothetical protein